MTTINSNIATKPAKSAAKKPLTKAERERNTLVKANASAAKKSSDKDFDGYLPEYVGAIGKGEGAARVMAHIMNHDFAEVTRDYRCHWSALTAANCRTDNEKAVLARINERKKQMQDLSRDRGVVNINRAWSDMQRIAKELHHGKAPRDTNTKPLIEVIKADVLHAYKKGMKEERQTEEEMDLMEKLGAMLLSLKVDITKY